MFMYVATQFCTKRTLLTNSGFSSAITIVMYLQITICRKWNAHLGLEWSHIAKDHWTATSQ